MPKAICAFEFKDFKWGTTKEAIIKKIGENKTWTLKSGNFIDYDDQIFGSSCKVQLSFTPIKKALYCIWISFERAPGIKDKLIKILTKKYGDGAPLGDKYGKGLVWRDPQLRDSIKVYGDSGSHRVALVYLSESYSLQNDKEKTIIEKEEANRVYNLL